MLAKKHPRAAASVSSRFGSKRTDVTTSLTNARDITGYAKVRGEVLGDMRPAFMLQVVTQLIRPEVLVEVEIIAARK